MKFCMNQRNHMVSKDQQAWSMIVELKSDLFFKAASKVIFNL